MKTFTMGLKALCVSVLALGTMTLTSCSNVDDLEGKVDSLTERVEALEAAQQKLADDLTKMAENIEGLYTLSFKVDAESAELLYSYDGEEWIATGVYVHEAHECVVKDVVENGNEVTFYFGESSVTIEKAQEIVFEIRAGKVYFASEQTQTINIKSEGIEDLTVISYPKGWYAEINKDENIEVTAPNVELTIPTMDYETWTEIPAQYPATGYVKVHATANGKCMIGKLPVHVSESGLSIAAYNGVAHFTCSGYSGSVVGIGTRESYLADVEAVVDAFNNYNYDVLESYTMLEGSADVPVAELLGAEPEKGVEYVVWGVMQDYSLASYSVGDAVLAYYQLVEVKAAEVVENRTAYNIDINLTVDGADSYIALAMPTEYMYDGKEGVAAEIVGAYANKSVYGKMYNKSYSGSLLDICAGTTYSMSGNYSPNSEYVLFVLPIDGRPADAYAATDVKMYTYKTAGLVGGGAVNATVEATSKKIGYDNLTWEEILVDVDPYREVAVTVQPTDAANWSAFYGAWLDDATVAEFGSNNTAIVNHLLESSYALIPSDVKEWPKYVSEEVGFGGSATYVCFFIDNSGKYGEISKTPLKAKEMVYSKMTLNVTSNLVDGVLKNTKDLVLTITPSEPASTYKYIKKNVSDYNQYEGMTPAQLVSEVMSDYETETVEASALVNNQLVVSNNNYGYTYMFALVGFDASGAPMSEAYTVTYNTVYSVDVISDPTKFVSEPEIVVNTATTIGEQSNAPCYYYEYQSWYNDYTYYYEVNYTVKPVAGTTVTSVIVRTGEDYYNLPADASEIAGMVIQGKYGSYYTYTHTEEGTTDNRFFSNQRGATPISAVLAVVWVDAAGNHYYKQIDLSAEYARMTTELDAAVAALPAQ